MGCYERTTHMFIEKYAGLFQLDVTSSSKILPISDKYNEYADKVAASLREKSVRVETDFRAEKKIGYKIREARLERTPLYFSCRRTRS